MEWNECILKYAKSHSECDVYGSTLRNEWADQLTMLVPIEDGIVLFQNEILSQGKGYSNRPSAKMKLHLNQSYELSVKKQNLLRKGWDRVTNEYIRFDNKAFMNRYSVNSNHAEYTKLALSDLEWVDFMMKQKELNLKVTPLEDKSLEHTITVYYHERFMDMMFSSPDTLGTELQVMLECCRLTARALGRYAIEDQENSI